MKVKEKLKRETKERTMKEKECKKLLHKCEIVIVELDKFKRFLNHHKVKLKDRIKLTREISKRFYHLKQKSRRCVYGKVCKNELACIKRIGE